MSKLSIRDKCILLFMILCFFVYAGYYFLWLPANAQIDLKTEQELELKGEIGDQTPLENQITELEARNEELTQVIDEHKRLQGGKALNKEDFLTFLTDECAKSDVELIKFNDLGVRQNNDGVWKVQLDFELRGNLPSLNQRCQAIDQINIRYSMGGFFFRPTIHQIFCLYY